MTPVTDGTVTLTFNITEAEGSNYEQASPATSTVNSTVELLTSVTAEAYESDGTTPDSGANVAAVVDGTTIRASGLVTKADGKLIITPTAASDFSVSPDSVTADVGSTDAVRFTVEKDGGMVATYTIDISRVTALPSDLESGAELKLENATVTGSAHATDSLKSEVVTVANTVAGTTAVSGLTAAAASSLMNVANAAESASAINKLSAADKEKYNDIKAGEHGYSLDVAVSVAATITGATGSDGNVVSTASGVKELTIDIAPTYTITAVKNDSPGHPSTSNNDKVQLASDTLSGQLATKVKVSIDISGFSGFVPNVAKHTHGTVTEWLPVTVNGNIASWYQQSFSAVALIEDTRSVTIYFTDDANNVTSQTYTAVDIGSALPAIPAVSGYTNNGWTVNGITATTLTGEILNLVGSQTAAISRTANQQYYGGGGGAASTETKTVTATATTNGSYELSSTTATSGTITITPKPSTGYEVDAVTVKDKNGNALSVTKNADGTYSFSMPASNLRPVSTAVTFKPIATPVKPEAPRFTDVPAGSYYADAVAWAVANGITNGKDAADKFKPNDICTRAEAVTFLYRAAGAPGVALSARFKDVASGSYYEKAVAWAVANGITNGKDAADKFKPNDVCSRAEIVTFLARFEKASSEMSTQFIDVPDTAYYAGNVAWAASNGITNGKDAANTFKPDDTCTRAEIVTFLYRDFVK